VINSEVVDALCMADLEAEVFVIVPASLVEEVIPVHTINVVITDKTRIYVS
jgi:hypothetical protein